MSNEEINHYHVLTVNNFASIDEIKRAYKIQSLKLHPDKNRDNIEEATKAFDALKKSYDILKDDELRGKHNISLRAQIESQKRFADLNESRKRFRDHLNANESLTSKMQQNNNNNKKIKLNNIRKESEAALANFNLIQQQKIMKKMNNHDNNNNVDHGSSNSNNDNSICGVIIVKWNKKKITYNENQLKDIFVRFGKIEFIRIGSKQKSAILQFYNMSSATLAYEHFSSLTNKDRIKLTVKLKDNNKKKKNVDNNNNVKQPSSTGIEKQEDDTNNKNNNKTTTSSSNTFNAFEDDVMARLQKAAGL